MSWSASISGGFKTPIHFSLPIVFALYSLFFQKETSEDKRTPFIYGGILLTFLITFYIGYQTIYRDAPRDQLTYDMGTVFPQLSTIKSDEATFNKYEELKHLAKKYPNFTVLPTVTLAHYLTKTVNPIGSDWPHDIEINFDAKRFVAELKAKNSSVFIEKTEFTAEDLKDYEMVTLIEKEWTLVTETKQFKVYSPPQ